MTERSNGGAPLYEGGEIVLGPATRGQLEAVLRQTAGGLLAAVIEASGYELDDGWALTIGHATLTHTTPQRNGTPTPHPSLSEAT